jgi:hypothetical protein
MLATKPGIALSLLFVSAATCSSSKYNTSRSCTETLCLRSAGINYIPLSAPLQNGTMALQVNCPLAVTLCLGTRGCCSNHEIQDSALSFLCMTPSTDESEWMAQFQHDVNGNVVGRNCHCISIQHVAVLVHIALCQFDGYKTDNLQLLLTPNASAILDSLNQLDERM